MNRSFNWLIGDFYFNKRNIDSGDISCDDFNISAFAITIPSPNPITNSANIVYNYVLDPNSGTVSAGSSNSNIINIQINEAIIDVSDGGMIKSVDKAYAKVGDVLTYTIWLNNTGSTTANGIVLTDTIPNGTSFVDNSVMLNGEIQIGSNPQSGIYVGTLGSGLVSTVTFQVTVTTIPTINPIPNSGTVNFAFYVDPNLPPVPGNGNSNIVTTQVNQAIIDYNNGRGLVKTASSQYVKVGDILTFTISLRNTGNTTATSVVLTDTIPASTTFVTDSVDVNGITQVGVNPQTGINVGTIAAGGASTVTFQVTVASIPSTNLIRNNSTVNFLYTVDPSLPAAGGSGNSNQTTSQVSQAKLNMIKQTNSTYAKVGDVITYTIGLTNTGNVVASSVLFIDTIPIGTTFISNSVTLNGVTQSGANPQIGFNIGNIAAGSTSTVKFQVTVATIPTINPILNNSTSYFQYIVNSGSPPVSSGANSNQVTTQINQAIIDNNGLTKTVSEAYAQVGDVLTYTIGITNTGNTTANDVIVSDTIPLGTTFVDDSVTVNTISIPGVNPQDGFNIGNIAASTTSTITFQVTIVSIPNNNNILNSATVKYAYVVNPLSLPATGSANSTIVSSQINQSTLVMVKVVNTKYAQIGDILNYTITVRNIGNTTASSILLTDTIPGGTTFVSNSVMLDGNMQIGVDPESGISIGNLGVNGISTVQFRVTVVTIPTVNPIPNNSTTTYQYFINPLSAPITAGANSNTVNTRVNLATINSPVKTVDKNYAMVGDTLTYTIVITNTGTAVASGVVFKDTIPLSTTFVSNSLTLNGVTQAGINPQNGLSVGSIQPDGIATVTFQVVVNTIPTLNPIPNNSTVSYRYNVNPYSPPISKSTNSNQVTTEVNQAVIDNGSGGLNKFVSEAYASLDDVLTYTIVLKNTGNTAANPVILTDTIPLGTTFVYDSVKINGITQSGVNPQAGVNVGAIAAGGEATVTFQVTVSTIPTINPIPNSATVSYQFIVNPSLPPVSASGNTNIVTTKVNQALISGPVKSVDKDYAKIGDVLTYTIGLKNIGTVTAQSVILLDTIPTGTTFVSNSVAINGSTQTGVNPQTGINIGLMSVGKIVTVTFKVVVNTIPAINPIPNNSTVYYQYIVNPVSSPAIMGGNSNEVTTQISQAILDNLTKTVDMDYATVGDILTYEIVFTNTGNVSAYNVILTDTIPASTSFIPDSVTVNGVPQPGENIQSPGVSLGSIPPGVGANVTFQVEVISLPASNYVCNSSTLEYEYYVDPTCNLTRGSENSNIVCTRINQAIIDYYVGGGFNKTVSSPCTTMGDTIVYTLSLRNTGNATANNVIVTDTVPTYGTFVPNSVTLNGVAQPGENPEVSGIYIGCLKPGSIATATFMVTVTTTPTTGVLKNSATTTFNYTVNPSITNGQSGSGNSNIVSTQINYAQIDSSASLTVNKSIVQLYDTLTYTVTLVNTGNINALNVTVFDTIPYGTVYIPGSVIIDGQSYPAADPRNGVVIPVLEPEEVLTVSYNVRTICPS